MYKHVTKHFYRITLRDGIEVRLSKSDFDFIIATRSEKAEYSYKTIVRTHKFDDMSQTDYIHMLSEQVA